MRRSASLLFIGLACGLFACATTGSTPPGRATRTPAADAPRESPDLDSFVHLVIDLGSSGTRMCLYRVSHPKRGGACRLSTERPVCSRVSGGLAKLTRGHRPNRIGTLVEGPLRRAWELLGDAQVGGDPTLRSQVRAAVALGTGGFRDRSTGQPLNRPEWRLLFSEVERFMKQEAGLAQIVAWPITGEEEGRLAWLGLAQTAQQPTDFAAIEAGGATIQLAVGSSAGARTLVEVASDPLGQDVIFERFVEGRSADRRAFAVCFDPKHPSKQDGPQCTELLQREVFQRSAVRRLAERSSPRRLYGLGLAFGEQFRSYPAAAPWPTKQDRAMHPSLSLSAIRELTTLLCPLTDAEIRPYAPNALAIQHSDPRGAGRACYYLAYRSALLATIQPVAAAATIHAADEDQWPRGAAIAGDFFPACR
ncbi:MAG: hypothetical protein E6Q99_04980 [Elusimicrobia bacterium]|nr:MAG: hypothetical protein E6Q99_04980 [Elusimicrobiota bacterium]